MKPSKLKRPAAARRRKVRPPNRARGEVRFDMGWVSDSKVAETLKRGEAYAMKPDRRWRVTFPKPMRDKYDIRPGDKLRWEREGNQWILVFPARRVSSKRHPQKTKRQMDEWRKRRVNIKLNPPGKPKVTIQELIRGKEQHYWKRPMKPQKPKPGDKRAAYLDWKHGSGAGKPHPPEESPLASEAQKEFQKCARRGNPKRLLALLRKMDREDRRKGIAGTKP